MPTYTDQLGPGKTGDGCITLSTGIVEVPSGCVLKGNTDQRGVATVLSGQTTIAVAFPHAQAAAPSIVMVTPQSDAGDEYFVTDLATTGFTINVASAVPGDTVFMWLALW